MLESRAYITVRMIQATAAFCLLITGVPSLAVASSISQRADPS